MIVARIFSLLSIIVLAQSTSLREDVQQQLNTRSTNGPIIPLTSSQFTARLPENFDGSGACVATSQTEAVGCYIYSSDLLFGVPITVDFTASMRTIKNSKAPQNAFSQEQVKEMIKDGCFSYNTDILTDEKGVMVNSLQDYTNHKKSIYGASAQIPINFMGVQIDIGFSMRNSKSSLRIENNDIQNVLINRRMNHGTIRNACLKSICENGKRCVDAYVNPEFKRRFTEITGDGSNIDTMGAERFDRDFGYFFPTEFSIGDAYEYRHTSNTSTLTEEEANEFRMQSSLNIKLGQAADALEMNFQNNMTRISNESSFMSKVHTTSQMFHKFMPGCDYSTTTLEAGMEGNDMKEQCKRAFEENILNWPSPYRVSKFSTVTDLFPVETKVHTNFRTAIAEGYFPCTPVAADQTIGFYSKHSNDLSVPTKSYRVDDYFNRFEHLDSCFTVNDLLVNGEYAFKCCSFAHRDCYLSHVDLPKGLKMTLYNLPDRNVDWEAVGRCSAGTRPTPVYGRENMSPENVWANDRSKRMCAGKVEFLQGYALQCYTYHQ